MDDRKRELLTVLSKKYPDQFEAPEMPEEPAPMPKPPTTDEELALLKKRQDQTENALMFLMDMNMMGGF